MKRIVLLATLAAPALTGAPALAATCDFKSATGVAFAPDYSAISVFFDAFTASAVKEGRKDKPAADAENTAGKDAPKQPAKKAPKKPGPGK